MRYQEYPSAQLSKLIFQANFKTDGPPKQIDDFLIFREEDQSQAFPPEAAAAAMALRMRVPSQCPQIIESIWPAVTKAASQNNKEVPVKAFRSKCGNVWILAPKIGDGKISGVIAVSMAISGIVSLYDVDRQFFSVAVKLKSRRENSYIAEGTLDLADLNDTHGLRPSDF